MEISEAGRQLAEALAPLAEAAGVARGGVLVREAPTLRVGTDKDRAPPMQVVNRCVELLNAPDGRHGLFMLNGELVAWDGAENEWAAMTAKRFRTWLQSARGVAVVAGWKKETNEETGETKLIPVEGGLSKDQAELVLASDQLRSAVPAIKGFNDVRLPVLDKGETDARGMAPLRLLRAGMDAKTGIFTGGAKGCAVDYVESMQWEAGIEYLHDLFKTFSFRCPNRDWSIHLAGLLTLFCRGMYSGKAPAICYNANIQESGKTRLATVCTWAVCGSKATKGLVQDQDARLEELLNSVALSALPYLIFDNVDWGGAPIKHELLDQWISNSEWALRRLHSQQVKAPKVKTTTFFTGNNITLSPDLQRRCLMADLWNPLPGSERVLPPGAVLIDDDFFEIGANRAKILAALWSLVKEWDANGRPQKPGRLLGSFEDWSRVVPAIIWHIGARLGFKWDCLAENTANEEVGDKRGRDWRKLAEVAIKEHGMDGETARHSFEVTVAQLAGVVRRFAITECAYHLRPESDLQSVLESEDRPGGWKYKAPPGQTLGKTQEEEERMKQAAEYLTPKSRSAFGGWAQKNLHDRYFTGPNGIQYHWRHIAGSAPSKYSVTQVKR